MSILGEERTVVIAVMRLLATVRKASMFIQGSLKRTNAAKGEARYLFNVIGDREAYQAYIKLRTALELCREVVTETKSAIREMKSSRSGLKGIEAYARDIMAKLKKTPVLLKGKPILQEQGQEQGILSLAINVESAMNLNIQRCEAIKNHMIELLIGWENVKPVNVRTRKLFSESVFNELQKVTNWYIAAFNSLDSINGVLLHVSKIETDVMRETLTGAKR